MKTIKIGICDFINLDELEFVKRVADGVLFSMKSGKTVLVNRPEVIDKVIAELEAGCVKDCSGESEIVELADKVRSERIKSTMETLNPNAVSAADIQKESFVTEKAAQRILEIASTPVEEKKPIFDKWFTKIGSFNTPARGFSAN